MTLGAPRDAVLREALSSRNRETFERALGRAVRKLGGEYADYLALVAELREYGQKNQLELRDAARALVAQP